MQSFYISERSDQSCVHFGITAIKGVKCLLQIHNAIRQKVSSSPIAVAVITRIVPIMGRINAATTKFIDKEKLQNIMS